MNSCPNQLTSKCWLLLLFRFNTAVSRILVLWLCSFLKQFNLTCHLQPTVPWLFYCSTWKPNSAKKQKLVYDLLCHRRNNSAQLNIKEPFVIILSSVYHSIARLCKLIVRINSSKVFRKKINIWWNCLQQDSTTSRRTKSQRQF